ncbi:MAG TPA: hypothetical protein VIH75_09660 [Candidatus Sulfotelmatobacter sp.]
MKAVTVSFVIAVAILALTPVSSRQQSKGPPAAPVAPQIAAAQKYSFRMRAEKASRALSMKQTA